MKDIFSTYQLGDMHLPNRIVMAPMTRSRVTAADALGPVNAKYYSQRASAGLIVSEASVVEPGGRGYLLTPGLYTDEQVAGCRAVVDAVHKADGRMFAQLWHVGRVAHTSVLPLGQMPVAPTADPVDGLYVFGLMENGEPGKVHVSPPRAMTIPEIERTIGNFAQAASNAKSAGFDGVEILAANGYLFDQFLNSVINTRTDAYGGSTVQGRAALVLKTVDAIRAALGSKFKIGVRLSPFGTFNKIPEDPATEETYLYLADELKRRHIAYVHFNDEPVSIGHLNEEAVSNVSQGNAGLAVRRLIPAPFLKAFRARFSGTVIICGGLDAALAQHMLDDGIADLFAFGVSFIANPDLPHRLRHNMKLAEPDTDLFYGGDERGYSDYPPLAERVTA